MDRYQRKVVDIAVQYAKDLLKAERGNNPRPEPPRLMVHGCAGSGKTHVIITVSEWVQLILQKSGDSMECPYVLKTAFTGTAASLIGGMTLHSAFGFDFGNKHYSLSDKARDRKKAQCKNLEMVIVDEISMVKSDMNYQLDLRLQEIKEKLDVPYGGVAILFFGDLLQLCPVQGKFVFEAPQNVAFKVTNEIQSRWKMMKVINLEENHRQGNSREYADLLNRIRESKQTRADLDKLRSRIRPRGHPDLESIDLNIVCTRRQCALINMMYLNNLEGDETVVLARHVMPTRKKFIPRISKKDGSVGNLQIVDRMCVKINCKVILLQNIDISDGLTNGQLGILKGQIKNTAGDVVKLIVEFKNEKVGAKNRQENAHLLKKYPKGTIIEKTDTPYKLSKKSTESYARVIQFPIKLAHAITAHKIQGQSLKKPLKVALDISSVFDDAQAYVMLSRVEDLDQLYILDDLKEEKIRQDRKALVELEKMNKRSLNAKPIPWEKESDEHLKIAHLNCMNFRNNHEDIQNDPTLMESDLLTLSETWLESNDLPTLDFYEAHYNSVGPGKGIAVFYKGGLFQHVVDITEDRMQLTKMQNFKIDVIAVYRSSNGCLTKFLDHIKNLISLNRPTIVCGDFNLCYKQTRGNKVTRFLEDNGFAQLVKEATHIKGRLIDHCYVRVEAKENARIHTLRYSPYYSDHDAICTTVQFV